MAQNTIPFIEYTIQRGDTPASIARRLGVSEREIASLGALSPGRTVQIPCPAGECRCGAFYVLRRSDTLLHVAQRHGLTLKALLEANPYLNPGRYIAGQVIVIPTCKDVPGAYTLRQDERLFDVLRRLRVDISTFCNLNPGVRPMDVRPGQTIQLPVQRPQT